MGSALGKALSMSTTSTWATVVSKIQNVASKTSGAVTASNVGNTGDKTALWAYIPSNGYYSTNVYLQIPVHAIAAAAYAVMYKRVMYTITSASGDGGWLRNNGTPCSHGYIRVDQISGSREIFGAEWSAIDHSDGWILHPGGYCLSGYMEYYVDQTRYPYYNKKWYQDPVFWLPCNYENTKYTVVVWYIITG